MNNYPAVPNEKAASSDTALSIIQENSTTNVPAMQEKSAYKVDSLDAFMIIKFPPRNWLLYPFIQEKGIAMISAGTGVGKTYLALSIALAVSTGTSFLRFRATKPARVLYIDGEMAAEEVQSRITALSKGMNINPADNKNLLVWTADRQPDNIMPNLAKPEGQQIIADCLNKNPIDLIIVDNLSVLCNGIRENDAESWAKFQDWLLLLRRQGYAVLEIQHNGKGGDYRGSSKQLDILNYTINLRRPDNYKKTEGARFEIHFGKTRGLSGDDVDAYEARLEARPDGGLYWTMSDIHSEKMSKRQEQADRAHELKSQGKTQQEIANIIGISIGKVNGLLKDKT